MYTMSGGVVRFCPYCAVYYRKKYTTWTPRTGGWEVCENATGSWHKVDILWGRYGFHMGDMSATMPKRAVFRNEGIICDGEQHYREMFEATVKAMEAEAAAGTFDVNMWKDSFPRRSMELLWHMEEVVEDALGDLPFPLISIVTDYLWQINLPS